MAWTTPLTAVANVALTAAQWNASVRDDLNETAPAKFTAANQYFVATGSNVGAARTMSQATYSGGGTDTTNSTTYIGLTGGPSVGPTTGTAALVHINSRCLNTTATGRALASFAVSTATTIASSDIRAIGATSNGASEDYFVGGAFLLNASSVALTAGTNTFSMEFRQTGGVGSFTIRSIAVTPL